MPSSLQKKKWTTEDDMVQWHYWLKGHEIEQTPGDIGGQRSLGCCSLWGLQIAGQNLGIEQKQ